MMRMLDTSYFKEPFVRGLSTLDKLFYLYVTFECDHAAVWIPDFEVAGLYLGTPIQEDDVLKAFEGRIVVLDSGKWFFPDILRKIYPSGLKAKNNVMKSVLAHLERHKLLDEKGELKVAFDEPLPKGSLRVLNKNNINNISKKGDARGKKKFIPPEVEEVIEYFVDNGYTPESAVNAFRYYEAGEWKDSTGKQVISWKQKMRAIWFKPENKKSISQGVPSNF